VTDTYLFDAFGNLLSKTGTTENDFLYSGEQYDINTGFYYLRARYMNPSTGTFTSPDAYAGTIFDPVSLHKYLYANANPVMNRDPNGYYTLTEMETSMVISGIIAGTMNSIPSGIMRLMNGASMDGNFWCMFATEFVFGFTMGALFAGLIYLAANCMLIAHLLNAYFGIMTGVFAWKAIDAFRNGNILEGILYSAGAILNLFLATRIYYKGNGLGGFNPSAGASGAGDDAADASQDLYDGARMTTDDALTAAEDFLGPGYRDMGNGRFVSVDGTRQVRIGESDILGLHGGGPHINFETMVPNPLKPGKMTIQDNMHIFLEG